MTEDEILAQREQLGRLLDGLQAAVIGVWASASDAATGDVNRLIRRYRATRMTQSDRVVLLRGVREAVAARIGEAVFQTWLLIGGNTTDVVGFASVHITDLIRAQLAGVPLVSPDADATTAIVARTLDRITAQGFALSESGQAAVRQVLVESIMDGVGPREAGRRIIAATEGVFNGGLARATTIARTELVDAYRATGAITMARNAQVLDGWMWWTSLGSRTCAICVAMAGTVHPLTEPGPEGHPNCRCARVPLVTGGNQPTQSGQDWLESQPLSVREQVLGPGRLAQWEDGRPLADMVEKRPNPGWRDSVQLLPLN